MARPLLENDPEASLSRSEFDMSDYQRILVALDFTDPSHEAALCALDLARRLGGSVTFLHVIDSRYMNMAPPALVEAPALQEERLRKVAHQRLEQTLADLPTQGVQTEVVVRTGVPCDEIIGEVLARSPDLLVMGSHGRRGLKRAILGSQAEAVMRRVEIPTLIVHSRAEAPFRPVPSPLTTDPGPAVWWDGGATAAPPP
jgi:nucleotide-binding universal stress UspA family protein